MKDSKCLWISRHEPDDDTKRLFAQYGLQLIPVGDVNGFDRLAVESLIRGYVNGGVISFACVHVGTAMNVASVASSITGGAGAVIWTVENEMRPVEGGKPTFKAKAIHKWFVEPCGVL